jgi:hypothetical protein
VKEDGSRRWWWRQEIVTIPSKYEEWNRSLLMRRRKIYTGKELVKVLEKLISKKSKETT